MADIRLPQDETYGQRRARLQAERDALLASLPWWARVIARTVLLLASWRARWLAH